MKLWRFFFALSYAEFSFLKKIENISQEIQEPTKEGTNWIESNRVENEIIYAITYA